MLTAKKKAKRGRPRKYASHAERQKAYRDRQKSPKQPLLMVTMEADVTTVLRMLGANRKTS